MEEVKVICDRCGKEYVRKKDKDKCPFCKSSMKRPIWEKEKIWITKNLAVVATLKYESKEELLPAFTNFYFGDGELKRNKIIFKNYEDLKKALDGLNHIIEFIGWKKQIEHISNIKDKKENDSEANKELAELITQYPSTVVDVLKSFDSHKVYDDIDLNLVKELIGHLNQGIFGAEEHVRISFKRILERISKQDPRAMEELYELLETNSLLEVTSVSRILMSRLTTLELFESMAYNEATYEIKGDNSIQNMLERNMWILNENWWLVQANKGLKKFIGDKIEKDMRRKRPDFVCVTHENKLIIVEIKRPSHEIIKEDIDQVEEYKLIAKEHKGNEFKAIDCYVVGKSIPQKARNVANERKGINLLTYDDLVEDVKKKYVEYLSALNNARESEAKKKKNENK